MRQLWDAGLAHRDIKPANLMVRDGRVFLIDAAFVQVRPSPWRQAVDLGNMMLVLAVRTDAERVYERALRLFTPDDIAEAFAATRGVASPTQLRAVMKQDGRDLLDEFRRLAPDRPPIALQRWSIGRVALALGVLGALVLGTAQAVSMFTPAYDIPISGSPDCGTGSQTILMAQAVPSATQIPCLATPARGLGAGRRRHRALRRLVLARLGPGRRPGRGGDPPAPRGLRPRRRRPHPQRRGGDRAARAPAAAVPRARGPGGSTCSPAAA